jgi:hypothetical protein
MAKSGAIVPEWWKAYGIPLTETDWRNIKLYCTASEDCWDWTEAVYFVRLAPPFLIRYGADDEYDTPLIYIGCGALKQRWGAHCKDWLSGLGRWLPDGRYEIWAFEHPQYRKIEQDALFKFQKNYRRLPLANRNGGADNQIEYDDAFYEVDRKDRRHWWALSPLQPDVLEYFNKGVLEDEAA